ncbi:hypothetical protein [Aquibacillus saliphilus]|uniref:hypothetical protein n=1 Tax=Aquibacillus saliphilus TaxID=1909422 RepID=UPI001CF01821|nr:hypothetical protein [Aquibacillus saliphilus]
MNPTIQKNMKEEKRMVTKKEFEKSYIDLMDRIRLIDQKLSTKADDVVLTITLAHRQEIEEMQDEMLKLTMELKKIKHQSQSVTQNYRSRVIDRNPVRNWFKKMHVARK